MTLKKQIEDREYNKFVETSSGEHAVRVIVDGQNSSSLAEGNSYSGGLFGGQYNGYIIDDNNPDYITTYFTHFGVEQYHMSALRGNQDDIHYIKLSPKKELSELRYAQSIITSADLQDKLVLVAHALGNANKDTTFNLIDGTGYFQLTDNYVTLAASIPVGTYNFTLEAISATITLSENVTVEVLT